ncbi:MAG: hypothetical protein QM723_23855 [Myxococcaceae bacterium]
MNKRYALFSAAVLLCACGSSFKPTYTPAAKGTEMGTMATQMIDGTGGTVTSSDGRLEVIVPAGMFTTATQVGIQPITNTAPNGVGVAYRLTPEGSMFSQAVTVKFHLDQTQMMGLDSTFVVTQHADGLWYSQPHQTRDASGQTVSVPAKHFSDWTIAQKLILSPQQTRVKATNSVTFTPRVEVDKPGDDLANPNGDNEVVEPDSVSLENGQLEGNRFWQVNQVTDGDTTNGTISGSDAKGDYTAPHTPPNPSQVMITITVESENIKVIAGASATVYTTNTWTGESHVTGPDGTKYDANFVFNEISDDHHGKHQFNVKSGNVHATVPATLPSGCTQSISPTDQTMGAGDGMMTVTYDPSLGSESDQKSPMVAGMGFTVWQATYTTVCPNGPGSQTSAVQAQWWPLTLGSAPVPAQATNGRLDTVVTGGGFNGNLSISQDL